jgi:methylglutaconyl-CoA hydratase
VGSSQSCADYLQTRLNLIEKNGPEATRITKTLIDQVISLPWAKARQLTVKTIAKKRVSSEGQEGMTAFFEKRRPEWNK